MRLFLFSPVLLLAGCALNCEEVGCSGALSIYLAGAVEDGEWSLEVTKDGETRTCIITLPDGEPVCASPLSLEVGAEGMTLSWLTIMGEQGDNVQIRISHDGALLNDSDFVPEWSEPYYPNGKACDDGNGCSNATADYSVD
jgi:hypothetical protein